MGFADWKSFLTLTFSQADLKYDVTQEQVIYKWNLLIRKLNSDLYGGHYTRKCNHSYFSYVLAVEPHRSGALHAHALVNKAIDWATTKEYWYLIAGRAYIEPVQGKTEKVSGYLSKYVTKGGIVLPYRALQVKDPPFKPYWCPGVFSQANQQGDQVNALKEKNVNQVI
jgi:hypothetical protein